MKSRCEVEIYGQTFIVSSEDSQEKIEALAAEVDRRMREIAGSAKSALPLRVAIMAALSFADEASKLREKEAPKPQGYR